MIESAYQNLKEKVFSIQSEADFIETSLDVFYFQYNQIPIYKQWVEYLKVDIESVKTLHQIPFLPIRFFKEHQILRSGLEPQSVFSSSGTTGMELSQHFVGDLSLYESSYLKGFEYFYGPINEYVVLALLPSYMEREDSSLIYMAEDLVEKSGKPESGFYLNEHKELVTLLTKLKRENKKVLLLGVSFALLDLADNFKFDFQELIIMETGGMKGRRKEVVRDELHQVYRNAFGVENIHSEYGMTELLSQAYSKSEGKFYCPPWMRILIRDTNDPLSIIDSNKSGGVNVIDLANLNSCSFIATQDLGKVHFDKSFEILGRFDNSELRGCNLMVL